MGFCTHLNEETAMEALDHAKDYIQNKQGLCLTSSAELYLGDIGALSEKNAQAVLPVLTAAAEKAENNEVDWILEAFIKICENLQTTERKEIGAYLERIASYA